MGCSESIYSTTVYNKSTKNVIITVNDGSIVKLEI